MDRAAAGLAASCGQLLGRVYGSRVVLLVGSGDNGGDALFAGARLASRGASVSAVLIGSSAHAAGLAALRRGGGRIGSIEDLARADLVLDGIVGIGGRGELRDAAASVLALIPAAAMVVAVDVPSGVDAQTGEVVGAAVRADATITFGAWKPGLLVDPGAAYAGAVELVDIGLAPFLPTASITSVQGVDVAALLPQASAESDKYRRGVLGIVAGSTTYTGAAVLATGGALKAGAGMVRFASVAHPAELVRARWPEAVVTVLESSGGRVLDGGRVLGGGVLDVGPVLDVGRVQAWVVGPGIGTDAAALSLLAQVLRADVPVVVDADALTLLGQHRSLLDGRRAPTILTPHAGELARVLGLDPSERADIEARRLAFAREAASVLGATVLLKGSTTVVATPAGLVRVNSTGTAWLATAGSGDVLSGVIGALLAGGLSALDAASCAAYLHGSAARIASGGSGSESTPASRQAPIVAEDVLIALPAAIRQL